MNETDFQDENRFELMAEAVLQNIGTPGGGSPRVQAYRETATGVAYQVDVERGRYSNDRRPPGR